MGLSAQPLHPSVGLLRAPGLLRFGGQIHLGHRPIKTVDSQVRFSREVDVFGRPIHYAQHRERITKS